MKQLLLFISVIFCIGLVSCSNDSKPSNNAAEQVDENVPCLCCEPVLEAVEVTNTSDTI